LNPSPHTAVDVGRPAGGKRAPARSREQRLRALAHANRIRTARAALKRDLAARRVEFARILTDPPACAANAKVRDLLLALPGIGPAKADRALARCRIAAAKTLAGLSDRQRRELTQLLHHH
jgi:guanylate kinase